MTERRTFCITGGSGFLGRHLIPFLARDGCHRIKYLSRRDRTIFPEFVNVELWLGDLLDEYTLAAFLERDAILIHLAYLANESREKNVAAITNLLAAAGKSGIAKFIHCSTAVVVGNAADEVIDENTPCRPQNEYERTKLQIEEILLGSCPVDLPLIILRPTAVFGKYGQNLNKLIEDLEKGSSVQNYIRKALFRDRDLNLVSVENVVEAICFLATDEKEVTKEIFIIADDDAKENNYAFVSRRIESILAINVLPFPVLQLPNPLLSFLLRVLGRSNTNIHRKYSSDKIAEWGWQKSHSFAERLDQHIKWFKELKS